MAWNNKQNKSKKVLQEAHTGQQMDITDLLTMPYYNFASQLTSLRGQSTYGMTSTIKEAMLKDPIISQIINMWISDALNKDPLTQRVFDVMVKPLNKEVSENDITIINNLITYLIENSNLESLLVQILYKIITDGIVSVKLGFIDSFEETKIRLFESNKKKILTETQSWTEKDVKSLLESTSYKDYSEQGLVSKVLTKNKKLKGRYYFEILPQSLVPLMHKGITILYLDLKNTTKVLNPRNITTFANTRAGVKTLKVKENPEDVVSTLYEVYTGKSFIENAVTPWSMSNTTQDCTLLALMTRSSIYRLFQIDVGTLTAKQTDDLLSEFKKRITSRETIDVRSQHYSSSQTQIPLGDSILIPTRNGIGSVNVQAIGGDLDIRTQVPLDYFREELLASLGIPKALLYGGENGGLINTSAIRQDIRYLRTVQQFTAILSQGLEDIFKDYLVQLGVNISKVGLTVTFARIVTDELIQRMEYEETKQQALSRAIESLSSLGITFENGAYKQTRDLLIKRFLDQELLDMITKDEELIDTPKEPKEDSKEDATEDTTEDLSDEDIDISDDVLPEPLPKIEPNNPKSINSNPPYSIS